MNNQSYSSTYIEQYLRLWMYLLPVIGVIPAVWTLYRAQQQGSLKIREGTSKAPAPTCPALRQQYQASRLAINLIVVWLSSYGGG